MREHRALGAAGRAGRVTQERGIVAAQLRLRCGLAVGREGPVDQDRRARVGDDVVDLVLREPEVDRHGDRAQPVAGEQRLGELEAVVEQHGHAVTGAHAARGERARDPRRPVVQFGVRPLHSVEDERHTLRLRVREQLAQVLSTVHALTPGAP